MPSLSLRNSTGGASNTSVAVGRDGSAGHLAGRVECYGMAPRLGGEVVLASPRGEGELPTTLTCPSGVG